MRYNLLIITLLFFGAAAVRAQDISDKHREFFENKIRPIMAENCYECHNSTGKKKGGLALDYKAALMAGGDSGAAIVPGNPDDSLFIQAIRHEDADLKMPSKKPKFSDEAVADFVAWVKMGAPDPRLKKPTKEELATAVDWETTRERRTKWWSFQPVQNPKPPRVGDKAWTSNPVDQFVFAKLQEHGLTAQEKAAPETLIRRLHLILTGLPPKPEVVEAFTADPSDASWEKLVDKLLASPQYGERWGRYWMDWFRYAESHGSEGDPPVPYAAQYRDYVIRAINQDVPYDQLLKEHIAGDQLKNPRINDALGLNESAIGPAHFRMVPHGFGVTDAYDEQVTFTDNAVDVLSKATMAMTVSCARCHNHKFDPISQKDFYKFYGMLVSARPAITNVDSPALQAKNVDEVKTLKKKVRAEFANHWAGQVDAAVAALEAAKFAPKGKPKRGAVDVRNDIHPFAAWLKLKDKPAAAVENGVAAQKKRYQDDLAANDKVKKNATYYADLRDQAEYDKWYKHGNALPEKVCDAGSFAMAPGGNKAFTGIYPRGVYTHMISPKQTANLSSIYHKAQGNGSAIRANGQGSICRFSARGYPLSHGGLHPAPGLNPTMAWSNQNKYKYWNDEQVFYLLSTGGDKAYKPNPAPSWFGVTDVYGGNERLKELGSPVVALPGDIGAITDRASLLAFYKSALTDAIKGWETETMTDAQADLLNAFVSFNLLSNEIGKLPPNLKGLVDNYRKLEGEIRVPLRAGGLSEGEVWDQPLLVRGDYKKEAEPVPRGFLEVFGGREYSKTNSGRLELAEDMVSDTNTLVTRVIVNRLWHHVFGRGIVASNDNFGRLGKTPSHPLLLDYLASDFRSNGWSMKRTIRQLVTSRAFKSGSAAPAASLTKDPTNLYVGWFTPRRLDAEAIHDTINTLASRINPEAAGGKTGGRAVYINQRRNSLNPFLTAFNYPIPTSTVGVRNTTNVPAQALVMMNGDIVRNAARGWSDQITRDGSLKTDTDRVNAFFMQAYSRTPTAAEMQLCMNFLTGKSDDGGEAALTADRSSLAEQLNTLQAEREAMVAPVMAKLQKDVDARNAKAEQESGVKQVDLKPIGRWDFDDGITDTAGELAGSIKGKARVENGALVLEGGCFMSAPVKKRLKAKTLEAVVELSRVNQVAGGAVTVQTTNGQTFDAIVYNEKFSKQWLSGSNSHRRTKAFNGPQVQDTKPVRITIVYAEDGTITGYRDGQPYGKPYKSSLEVYNEYQIVFGLRHGTGPAGSRALYGKIHEARVYDRALTAEEVAASAGGALKQSVTPAMVFDALKSRDRKKLDNIDIKIKEVQAKVAKLNRELQQIASARGGGTSNHYKIAHAIMNSKELIYVY
jgi:mono/diheme cytochrome c family protein